MVREAVGTRHPGRAVSRKEEKMRKRELERLKKIVHDEYMSRGACQRNCSRVMALNDVNPAPYRHRSFLFKWVAEDVVEAIDRAIERMEAK